MTSRARRYALALIGVVAMLASLDALVHSYADLYGWAAHHRLGGWQAVSWPAEIDVFLVVGELALYVAYLDAWPWRQRIWPWVTAITGLAVSVTGNIGHIQAVPRASVTLADGLTAAASPVAAFAGLMIGLLVLKMSTRFATTSRPALVIAPEAASLPASLLRDAVEIAQASRANAETVTQRALAAQLRERGHRFSNSQLREVAEAAESRLKPQRSRSLAESS